jgi:hypothetical protein
MFAVDVSGKSGLMPTRLKRISVALDDEAYARLEELAQSNKRSVANMAAVLIESALFPGGRVVTAPKEDRRGGKREGAGRKPKPKEPPEV